MSSPRCFLPAAALAACLSALPAQANLFTNPGFEDPGSTGGTPTTVTTVASGLLLPSTSTAITGWSASTASLIGLANLSSNVQIVGSAQASNPSVPTSPFGNYSVHLNSVNPLLGIGALPTTNLYTQGSLISQVVNLAASTTYRLSFFYRSENNVAGLPIPIVNPFGNPVTTPGSVAALVGYDTGFSLLNPATLITGNVFNIAVGQDWTQAMLEFTTGAAGDVRFTFVDGVSSLNLSLGTIDLLGGTNNNASVDGFDLVAVPELSDGWMLLGVGLAAAAVQWRRRRLAAAADVADDLSAAQAV